MTNEEWKEIQKFDIELAAALKKGIVHSSMGIKSWAGRLDGDKLKWAWNKMKEEIEENRKEKTEDEDEILKRENERLHQRVQSLSETYIKLFISHLELLDDSLPHWRKHCHAELEQLRDFLEPHKKGR